MNNEKMLKFFYKTNTAYKSHYINGVIGGLTPKGDLKLDFFSENFPVPNSVVHELLENNNLGKEIQRELSEGIIREIECGLVMNLETAKSINQWLTEKIKEIEKFYKKSQK
ncbi:hypothetical protein JXA84_04920 [candidate division WOR-3 bacterium]|nr:hypothetical protein [candidate division WOR-3 bacterium]